MYHSAATCAVAALEMEPLQSATALNGASPHGFSLSGVPQPTAREKAQAEVLRLVALDDLAYIQHRKLAAKELCMTLAELDRLVSAARPAPLARQGSAASIIVEPEPWPHAVRLAGVMDELAIALKDHVAMPEAALHATIAWIVHTYVYKQFEHTPRLHITSAAKRCGKSTLMEVLRLTSYRALKADSVSPSSVFRIVEKLAPLTLLVDEADTFMKDNEELRGVINSGFEQQGRVLRTVETKTGLEVVAFPTFTPMALAGIGALPGTIEDRAIPIRLQRAPSNSTTKLREEGRRQRLVNIGRQLARWAADEAAGVPADVPIPTALNDREGDISLSLLAVAHAAGALWPRRIWDALLDVFGKRNAEGERDAGPLALADIRALFLSLEDGGTSLVGMSSNTIIQSLAAMEDRPWSEWRAGKPITAPQLARLLKPFGATPGDLPREVNAGRQVKGYRRAVLAEIWHRYLLAPSPSDEKREIVTYERM